MKTTIASLYEFRLCTGSFIKLLNNLFGKDIVTDDLDLIYNTLSEKEKNKEISFLEILESNGVEDAFWCLRTQNYKDYCLILADVTESVLHIFEEKCPDDKRPREYIEGIRKFHDGEITKEELKQLFYNNANTAHANAAAAARKKQWERNEKILRNHLTKGDYCEN